MAKITACINCGSRDVSWKGDSIAGTVYFGALGGQVQCGNCGHVGAPIEFKSEKDYGKFLDALKKRKKPDGRG
ncbi:MAG: hypothetical protein NT157_04915 [Candidatus Micrarchaeota archaeon]|nr:hypothetical protein [Candidatus Micrarchaeota archaeon]